MRRQFRKKLLLTVAAAASIALSSCKKTYEQEMAAAAETVVSVEEGDLTDSKTEISPSEAESLTSTIEPTVPASNGTTVITASGEAASVNNQNAASQAQNANSQVTGSQTQSQNSLAAAETAAVETSAPVIYENRDETVYIMSDDVNIRTTPVNGEVIGKANTGDSFHRTGYSDSWSRIEYSGQTAYVSSDYTTTKVVEKKTSESVSFDSSWEFAGNSKINSGTATLYYASGSNKKGKTVCVNAGHGTSGGERVKTLCHPDGTAKATGGSTAAGATTATAVSSGTTMADGTSEAAVNLKVAKAVKAVLLERGYNVLMIRESEDVQLDNIARTVMANERANCHIAIHYDSTSKNKGAFFMSVADGIKNMYPVSTIWQESDRLGTNIINGLSANGVKIFSNGSMQMDLTQTSYSKIPSIDLELGDKASDYSDATVSTLAKGIADGLDAYFG